MSSTFCRDSETKCLFQACPYWQLPSKGTWKDLWVTIEKGAFENQRWICVMIVNDLFSCPLSQTAESNFYSSFFFVTVSRDGRVSISADEEVNEPLIQRGILISEIALWWISLILKKNKKRRANTILRSFFYLIDTFLTILRHRC